MTISDKALRYAYKAFGVAIGACAVIGGSVAAVTLFPMTSLPVFVTGVMAVAAAGLVAAVMTTVRRNRSTFRIVDWVLTSLALATNLTVFWSVTFYLSLCLVTGMSLLARAALRRRLRHARHETDLLGESDTTSAEAPRPVIVREQQGTHCGGDLTARPRRAAGTAAIRKGWPARIGRYLTRHRTNGVVMLSETEPAGISDIKWHCHVK